MKKFYICKGYTVNGKLLFKDYAVDEVNDVNRLNIYSIWKEDGLKGYYDVSKDITKCPAIQIAEDYTCEVHNGLRFVDLVIVAEDEEEALFMARKFAEESLK